MATNLESAYHLTQLMHALLKASGAGVVLFNSSVAGGPTAMKSGSIYAMTKAALNQLTRNLACEWCVAPRASVTLTQTQPPLASFWGPISCTCACGHAPCGCACASGLPELCVAADHFVACRAQDKIRVNSVAPWYTATELALQVLKDESYKQQVLGRTPMQRIGTPEEVAGEGPARGGPQQPHSPAHIPNLPRFA